MGRLDKTGPQHQCTTDSLPLLTIIGDTQDRQTFFDAVHMIQLGAADPILVGCARSAATIFLSAHPNPPEIDDAPVVLGVKMRLPKERTKY